MSPSILQSAFICGKSQSCMQQSFDGTAKENKM